MLHAGVLKKFGLYGLIRIALPMLPGRRPGLDAARWPGSAWATSSIAAGWR